jgi:hypothetical protein
MECIWRAWEYLRFEAAMGLSTWWLNHADRHMRVLMDKEGSFKKFAYDGETPHVPRALQLSRTGRRKPASSTGEFCLGLTQEGPGAAGLPLGDQPETMDY